MKKIQRAKLEEPLKLTREEFIYPTKKSEEIIEQKHKGRVQTVTFTLNSSDLEILEQQLDRAISLQKRNKSKSTLIRMALRALANTSDDEYSNLYNKF